MLGADLETERCTDLKYKLYRIDLMTDVTINWAKAVTKDEAGLSELNDLFEYRMENPHMFTGMVERVRIRIDERKRLREYRKQNIIQCDGKNVS